MYIILSTDETLSLQAVLIDRLKDQIDDVPEVDLNTPKIIEDLRSHYLRTEKIFYSIDWMDSYLEEEDLSDLYVSLVYVTESDIVYDMYESFDKCSKPLRALWIADAGMGKTTACKKIAVDWSQNSTDFCKYFPGIDFVIFLKCREFEPSGKILKSVSELLLSEPVGDKEVRQLYDYLKHNASSVLFVIDGVDELQQINKDFDEFLQGKIFGGASMIITSRREGLKGCKKYFSASTFEIVGFTRNGVKQFVTKFYNRCNSQLSSLPLLDKINTDETLKELSRNPLSLLILCVVWEDKGEELPWRKHDLYNCFVEIIVERIVKKSGGKYEEIDYQRKLTYALGKLAYDTLKNQKTSFSHLELRSISSAFQINHRVVTCSGFVKFDKSGKKRLMWYEFFHKTFQEFFACLYVAQRFRDAQECEKEIMCKEFKWLLEIIPGYMAHAHPRYCFCKWAFPVVVSFLCGSLEVRDFDILFREVFVKVASLEANGWHCWRGLVCPLLKELLPEKIMKLSTVIADVLSCSIEMEGLAYINSHSRLSFITGPLQDWASMKQYCHLSVSYDLSEDEVRSFDAIMMNKSSQIQILEVAPDCLTDVTKLERFVERFWISNIEVLNLNFAKKR